MTYKENDKYSNDEILIARFAKALGHPARIQILKMLAGHDSCFCGNIVDYLPLSQSTVSQHLKELKDAGFIQGKIEQPKVYYCINKENWKKAKELFDNLLKSDVITCG
jgi:ArsR family transcriptional regulator, arsenate/arsenite/antimonite-responsive transcriptional repressor